MEKSLKSLAVLALGAVFVVTVQSASSDELVDESHPGTHIDVSTLASGNLQFKLCQEVTLTSGLSGETCRILGKKGSYSQQDLSGEINHLHHKAELKGGVVAGSALLAGAVALFGIPVVVAGGASALGVTAVGTFLGSTATTATGIWVASGVVGAGITTKLELSSKNLNPFLTWSQSNELKLAENSVDGTEPVQVKDIDQFAGDLETVLNQIS